METMERLEQRSGMLAASSRCWSGRQGSRIPATEGAFCVSLLVASNLEGDNDRTRRVLKYNEGHCHTHLPSPKVTAARALPGWPCEPWPHPEPHAPP